MNHDDTSIDSMFDVPRQPTQSTAIEAGHNVDLTIDHPQTLSISLAATQEFEARHTTLDDGQTLKSPVVDNFLPAPNRFLFFGSLGLVSALGLGAVASSFLTYRTTVTAPATVEPVDDVQTVQAIGGGTTEKIFVKNYDSITSGQVIASLDNSSLRTEIFNIEAQVTQLQEQLAQVESEITALEQRPSIQSTFSTGESQALYYSQGLLLSHRSDLNAQLNYQQDRLSQAEKKLENLIVSAPSGGILYDLNLNSLGQSVQPNDEIAKVIPEDAALEIRTSTNNANAPSIEVGSPARINLANCKPVRFQPLPGQVSSIEPIISGSNPAVSGGRSYTITIEPDAEELQSAPANCQLLPGMEGEITIIARQEKLFDFFLRKLRLKKNA
ncbi:MAG: HlyD family efflux transporter periplasmic adaptor subunit [Cyanobacteria bacterium P01_F01_bin.116]